MLTLDQEQLLEEFCSQSDRLFDLEIIRTDSFTGEIGEYIACVHFGLRRTHRSTRAVDAVNDEGIRYQIKAKLTDDGNFGYSFDGIDSSAIDFLAIAYFDSDYRPTRLIRIPSHSLSKGRVGISQKFLDETEHVSLEPWEIRVPNGALAEILRFGSAYKALLEHGVIRSRRIVGDLGEFYACYHLGLTICDNRNQEGIDAVGPDGTTYEIKTRRVYESGRRESRTRRLNRLDGKSAVMLVVVALDKGFRCAGMWTIPMVNIEKPQSAHLEIVNSTPGVRNIVKSRVHWLR